MSKVPKQSHLGVNKQTTFYNKNSKKIIINTRKLLPFLNLKTNYLLIPWKLKICLLEKKI